MGITKRRAISMAAGLAAAALVASGPAATAGAATHRAAPAGGYSPVGGRFYGVSATSPWDVWAVGLSDSGTLIQHWNGEAWSTSLESPGYFFGVAARYWNEAWAVGGSNWFSPVQTIIYHWNGSSWTQVPSPTPGGGASLGGVVATSRRNAWAVGMVSPGGAGVPASYTTPLVEHWNGRRWQVQRVVVPASGGQLRGVAATSARDVWAVGWTGGSSEGNNQQTLIEHWNGKVWRRVPSPNPRGATSGSSLISVTVTSPVNAWAIGDSNNGFSYQTLIEHWNGRTWKIVPSPTPDGDDQLFSGAAVSARNAWAVGMTYPSYCSNGGPSCGTLIEHWNGRRWSVVPSPNPPAYYLNALWGVVSFYRNAWAVGTTDYSQTLVLRYNGKNWS
jgi:hypothetical protein